MSFHSSPKLHLKRGNVLSVHNHKWLCAPKGAGFLYARPERQSLLQPLIVSWGWQPRTPGISPFQDLFGWTGTADPSAYLSVPAAIQFQQQHDWPAVRAAAHALAAEARARIAALTGLPPICPDTPDWFVQMCACPLPVRDDLPAETLQTRLFDSIASRCPSASGGASASSASPFRRTTLPPT